MSNKTRNLVLYRIEPDGYIVRVMSPSGETVEEYSAGNSIFDSTTRLPVGAPGTVSEGWLRKYALQTAREMAEEHGALDPIEEETNDGDQ